MNGIGGNCRMMSIGGAIAGGVVLWILLALGDRGWFSSLLIAALLAVASALLLLALVCRDAEASDEVAPASPAKNGRPEQGQVADMDTATTSETEAASETPMEPASGAAVAETGGRETQSEPPNAMAETRDAGKVNDTAVLDADDGNSSEGDLGEEVSQAEALDREAAEDEAVTPDMPDGVAADLRRKPELLDAPHGDADDLKRLRGVGPKLEDQLNRLGVWHLSQIAAWSEGEAAWIDDHLEGFKGRVLRDDWIGQARELTDGA